MLWTLNSLLAKTSYALTSLQEARSLRHLQRTNTLGAGAEREASKLPPSIFIEADDVEPDLTPAQIQQFQLENNALLDHMSSTLSSVLAAEKSLLEVSALQTELVSHLVQQTEMTDRLYDEAVGSVADVKGANVQLKRAAERGREGRMFLLIFLIGASLGLLFLDWYS